VGRRRLAIYPNDHLAGAALGTELARRAQRENDGTALGSFLGWLLTQIRDDRAVLEAAMRDLGIPQSRVKRVAAMAVERIGRLKLNGQLTGYSPLSRVVELEGLTMGVHGKRALWDALEAVSGSLPELAKLDYTDLKRRADEQLEGLAREHASAAAAAFDGGGRG
jgi:hypothetical protein